MRHLSSPTVPAGLLITLCLVAASCAGMVSSADLPGGGRVAVTNPPATTVPITASTGPGPTATAGAGTPASASPSTGVAPEQDPGVERILAGYTTWTDPGFHSTDDRNLQSDQWVDVSDGNEQEQVSCAPHPLPTATLHTEEFPAVGFSGDRVLPGLVIDGSAVTSGDLRPLPLDRAPFILRSSLASANPTALVDAPDTGTIGEAVATLKRDADPRLGSIDVTSSDVNYQRTETHSFEQSALEVGVSLRYRSPLVRAGLDVDYSQERSVERHTITVRLVQRQLTLSMVDDAISHPGQYFADTVTTADVERAIGSGAIGAANPPMVIDQVAYGRLMYFTMSSTSVRSATELTAAIDAAKGSYDGQATVDARHQAVLDSSEIEMVAYGGDEDLALAAIRTGDLSQFFGSSNPTTAAPLVFTVRTLDGRPVSLTETADVNALTCNRSPKAHEFRIEVSDVQGILRVYVDGDNALTVEDDNPVIGRKVDGKGTLGGDRLNRLLTLGDNDVRLEYANVGCDDQFTVRFYRGSTLVETYGHPNPGCRNVGSKVDVTFTVNTVDGSVVEK